MATTQDSIIQSIRRIAGVNPEAKAELDSIQNRGGIDGIKTELGGDGGTGEEEDCCKSKGGGSNSPDSDDGWYDCTTGQSVTFDPNGFPRGETCKECGPDETWQAGYWWDVRFGFPGFTQSVFSSANGAKDDYANYIGSGYTLLFFQVDQTDGSGNPTSYQAQWELTGVGLKTSIAIVRSTCSAGQYDSGVCTTEAPERCGDDWEADNTTNYALIDGCITASSCDPEASQQSQQCNECITICNSAGEEHEICAGPDDSYLDNGLYGSWSGYY